MSREKVVFLRGHISDQTYREVAWKRAEKLIDVVVDGQDPIRRAQNGAYVPAFIWVQDNWVTDNEELEKVDG